MKPTFKISITEDDGTVFSLEVPSSNTWSNLLDKIVEFLNSRGYVITDKALENHFKIPAPAWPTIKVGQAMNKGDYPYQSSYKTNVDGWDRKKEDWVDFINRTAGISSNQTPNVD